MWRFFLLTLVAAVAAAVIADRKGRSWLFWGILCAFFPILIVLIFLLPPKLRSGVTKRCPYCDEVIRHDASLCKHCGRELPIELVRCPNCDKYVPKKDYCSECNKRL